MNGDKSLVDQTIAMLDVLKARAAAGDSRAAEALERHPLLSPAWVEESAAERRRWPTITAWVESERLAIPERGEGEAMEAWRLRAAREYLGLSLIEAVSWVREVTS